MDYIPMNVIVTLLDLPDCWDESDNVEGVSDVEAALILLYFLRVPFERFGVYFLGLERCLQSN